MSTKALSQGTSNCTKVSGLVLWVDNLLSLPSIYCSTALL